jgi:hypothetical protein
MTPPEEIEFARTSGVQRGINASIQTIEKLREMHSKRSSGYNDLTIAIGRLQALTVEQAEEIN